MKKGFTIVELAIVLVIIGILVGGILVGQSLINSAKDLAFVKQITQYDIAISGFKSKYKNLPGDTKMFSGAGDRDGLVRFGGDDNDFTGELAYFWQDMTMSGMLPNNEVYTAAGTGIIAGTNLPKANIRAKGNVGIMVGVCADGCLYPQVNTYWVSHFPKALRNTWGGVCGWTYPSLDTDPCGPSMSPLLAGTIDSKIDDGKPLSGNVWAGAWNEWDTLGGQPQASAVGCNDGARYWVETTELKCALQLKVGFAAGIQ